MVPLVEQELPTLPEHLSSPPPLVFSGVRVIQSLVLCVMFCRSLFVLCTFSFDHCVVCPSIYGFFTSLESSKKSLKIPKGQSESIYQRRTDNTMAKRTNNDHLQFYVCFKHKTKDGVTRTSLKTGGELRCSERVSSSCSTSDTRHVNLVTNPVITLLQSNDHISTCQLHTS